jgi:hypothetical protein
MTKPEFAMKLAEAVTMYRRELGASLTMNDRHVASLCLKRVGLATGLNQDADESPIVSYLVSVFTVDRSHPEFTLRVYAYMEEAYEAYQKMIVPPSVHDD